MQKMSLFHNERLSRLLTSLLLCLGVLWPLLLALQVENMILAASLVAGAVLGLLILQGVSGKILCPTAASSSAPAKPSRPSPCI